MTDSIDLFLFLLPEFIPLPWECLHKHTHTSQIPLAFCSLSFSFLETEKNLAIDTHTPFHHLAPPAIFKFRSGERNLDLFYFSFLASLIPGRV